MGKNDNGNARFFLREELSIECWTEKHITEVVIPFGLPMFGAYVVGVPLFGLLTLLWKQHLVRHLALTIDEDTGETFLAAFDEKDGAHVFDNADRKIHDAHLAEVM